MNRIKRFTAFLLIMGAMLSLCSFAQATEGYPEIDARDNSQEEAAAKITVTPASESFKENNGHITMAVTIKNGTGNALTLAGIQPSDGAIVSAYVSPSVPGTPGVAITIPAGSSNVVTITAKLDSSDNSTGNLIFLFNYNDENGTNVASANCKDIKIIRTASQQTNSSDSDDSTIDDSGSFTDQPTEDTEFRIRTSSVDPSGMTVSTPSGDYGEELTIRLPLVCTKGYVYDVKVTPVLSTDVEKFPFDIDLVDYTLCYSGYMNAGQVIEFMYPMRLSKKATVGVKQVDFTVTYRNGEGELKSGTVSLFVNVRKGLTATNEDASPSVPRLIIESYSLSSDKIYAGETFDLNFDLRNTSSSENIQNIQIRVKDADATATIVPASGGSNSLYVSKISRGESSSQKISLQTAPDAEAKAYTLSLEFTYEAASTNASHTTTETISIPILQKIRLKCDDPVIYDDMGWVGSACSMYVRMYNMGRSSVYNCMVDVEGPGLKMEESYFGGTLAPGSTLSADFSVIPSEAGDIQGTIIISYEDVYGEPGEERLPFTLYVEDPAAMMPTTMEEEFMVEPEPVKKGMPWWGWVLGAGAVGGGGTMGVKALRKRRERMLEEDI